jgi:hypothetical protein
VPGLAGGGTGTACPLRLTSTTIFLLSPANLSGKRGQMLLDPEARSALARKLATQGAPLAEAFSFVSGLYFRGKVAYAAAYGRAPAGVPSAYVMAAGGGLLGLEQVITAARIRAWRDVSVSEHNPHFTAPLLRQCSALVDQHEADARFVLLGSIASNKYVTPLLEVFADRLLFPASFAGKGDMSRGSLMLRSVREQRELEYVRVASTRRR